MSPYRFSQCTLFRNQPQTNRIPTAYQPHSSRILTTSQPLMHAVPHENPAMQSVPHEIYLNARCSGFAKSECPQVLTIFRVASCHVVRHEKGSMFEGVRISRTRFAKSERPQALTSFRVASCHAVRHAKWSMLEYIRISRTRFAKSECPQALTIFRVASCDTKKGQCLRAFGFRVPGSRNPNAIKH